MALSWCVGGRHMINTNNIIEFEKLNPKTKKTVKVIKGVCNNFGYRKSLDKGVGVSRFSVEVFVSLYRNTLLENTLVFQKNSFVEIFHA